jgi:hypothetical protein
LRSRARTTGASGWRSRSPPFGRRVRRSRPRDRYPRRLLHLSEVVTIRGGSHRPREKRRAGFVPGRAVSMPSEGGGSTRSKGSLSLAPPLRGVSFGCRGDADVGRGWPSLVPTKIAHCQYGVTEHQDALFPGLGRERSDHHVAAFTRPRCSEPERPDATDRT